VCEFAGAWESGGHGLVDDGWDREETLRIEELANARLCHSNCKALPLLRTIIAREKWTATYQSKKPSGPPINLGTRSEDGNLDNPGNEDEHHLGDVHAQLDVLEIMRIELHRSGLLQACCRPTVRVLCSGCGLFIVVVLLFQGRPDESRIVRTSEVDRRKSRDLVLMVEGNKQEAARITCVPNSKLSWRQFLRNSARPGRRKEILKREAHQPRPR
jgi:hypothetical protein